MRPHQLLVELTEWTMDWVCVESPDGWTDQMPVGGTGEGTFTWKDESPKGEYTIVPCSQGRRVYFSIPRLNVGTYFSVGTNSAKYATIEEGDHIRIDIPDETDSDQDLYHGKEGRVVSVREDAADSISNDERDSTIYTVEFESGEQMDFRWRDLRPPIDSDTRTVEIDVVRDSDGEGGFETFGVALEHRPDLPKPFDQPMQKWVKEHFEGELEPGESLERAAVMEYYPNGEIAEFRKL